MKKIKNLYLLIFLLVLAAFTAFIFLNDRKKGERTFRQELFTIDSARISAITIYPKGAGDTALILAKTGRNWTIAKGRSKWQADTATVQNLLSTLGRIRAERVAGKDPSGWAKMELTDSMSTRVVVEQEGEVVADFRVGKISFSQGGGRMQGYGRNQNFSAASHIRIAGDDRVYVVDGFLSMMFSGQVSMYRNRTILRLDKNLLTRLTFTYPGDSSFVLEKGTSIWLLNGKPGDSAAMASYLSSICNMMNSEFAKDETKPLRYDYILKIEGSNMNAVEVKGCIDPITSRYFINSTSNPAAVFESANAGLFNRIFKSKKSLETSPSKRN